MSGDAVLRRWVLEVSSTSGQLARQRYGNECLLMGFTTFDGTVTASTDWGGPAERKRVRAATADSHESFLHEAEAARFWLDMARLLCTTR